MTLQIKTKLKCRRIPIDNPQESARIRTIFDTIASRYDLANHLLSMGTDYRWRRKAVQLAAPASGQTVLDMCCGTGDLLFAFVKAQPHLKMITGCDFSDEMISIAEKKQAKISTPAMAISIRWLRHDCLDTGLEDETFDVISCAFGVRNMANLKAGLAEMYRLLKPGGKVCILEFSLPSNPVIRMVYLFYFRFILPIFAAIITGAKTKEYKYLVTSVMKWHRQVDLSNELARSGFSEVTEFKHSFGLATTYLAGKRS